MDWPIPHKRQRGRPATARARRQGTISAPEMASSTKLQAGSQLLMKSSWDPGLLTSARRVVARDQTPEETHSTAEMVFSWCTQDTKGLGLGR